MDTTIRLGARMFYGDSTFSHGLSRSGYFNKREALDLEMFGSTFEGLYLGTLVPDNEEEQQFIMQVQDGQEPELYAAKLWKKYLAAVEKSKRRHGFMASEARSASNFVASAETEESF